MVNFITNKFIAIAICTVMTGAVQASTITLKVEFKKIKQLQGNLIIELFDLSRSTSEDWQEIQPIAHHAIILKSFKQTFQFSELSTGRYAIRVFQDINSNQLLDKSTNDLPLEPVGFSQNPSLFKGEPTIQDCAINLNNDNEISITLRHRKSKRKRRR